MVEQIIANKDNIEKCKEILLNNVQVLIDNYIESKEMGITLFERNLLFNILFAKNVIESIENDDLLELIEDVNVDLSEIFQLKTLNLLPDNYKYN